jgi:hypothetical protein
MAHELSVGMRVKVVAAKDTYARYNGKSGTIAKDDSIGGFNYPYKVALDDGPDSEWFATDEIAPIDASTSNATVIEGVVDDTRCGIEYPGVWVDDGMNGVFNANDELAKFTGKRVRVTIEVLADSAESDGDAE